MWFPLLLVCVAAAAVRPVKVFSRLDDKLVATYKDPIKSEGDAALTIFFEKLKPEEVINIIKINPAAWNGCNKSENECVEKNLILVELCHEYIQQNTQLFDKDALLGALQEAVRSPDEIEAGLAEYTMSLIEKRGDIPQVPYSLLKERALKEFPLQTKIPGDHEWKNNHHAHLYGPVNEMTKSDMIQIEKDSVDNSDGEERKESDGEEKSSDEEESDDDGEVKVYLLTSHSQLLASALRTQLHMARAFKDLPSALGFEGFYEDEESGEVWMVQSGDPQYRITNRMNVIRQAKELVFAPINEHFMYFLSRHLLEVTSRLEDYGINCFFLSLATDPMLEGPKSGLEDEEIRDISKHHSAIYERPWESLKVIPGPCTRVERGRLGRKSIALLGNLFGYFGKLDASTVERIKNSFQGILSPTAIKFLQDSFTVNQSKELLKHAFIAEWDQKWKGHPFLDPLLEMELYRLHGGTSPCANVNDAKYTAILNQALSLNDEYREIKVLGKGGFGTVMLAENTRTGEEVAIKKLNPENGDENFNIALHEATVMNDLRGNEHVVRFIQAIPVAMKTLDLVMERLQGMELYDYLHEHAFDREMIRLLAHDMASGIQEMHSAGYVHRDIKPENAYVMKNGLVKVIDMGTAFHLDRDRQMANEIAGTPIYHSPDRFGVKPPKPGFFSSAIGKPHDVWAFGVSLFQMICGDPIWDGDEWESEMDDPTNTPKIDHAWLQRRCEIKSGDPKRWNEAALLEQVALSCLTIEAKDRATIDQVVQRLRQDLDISSLRQRLVFSMEGIGEKATEEQKALTKSTGRNTASKLSIENDLEDEFGEDLDAVLDEISLLEVKIKNQKSELDESHLDLEDIQLDIEQKIDECNEASDAELDQKERELVSLRVEEKSILEDKERLQKRIHHDETRLKSLQEYLKSLKASVPQELDPATISRKMTVAPNHVQLALEPVLFIPPEATITPIKRQVLEVELPALKVPEAKTETPRRTAPEPIVREATKSSMMEPKETQHSPAQDEEPTAHVPVMEEMESKPEDSKTQEAVTPEVEVPSGDYEPEPLPQDYPTFQVKKKKEPETTSVEKMRKLRRQEAINKARKMETSTDLTEGKPAETQPPKKMKKRKKAGVATKKSTRPAKPVETPTPPKVEKSVRRPEKASDLKRSREEIQSRTRFDVKTRGEAKQKKSEEEPRENKKRKHTGQEDQSPKRAKKDARSMKRARGEYQPERVGEEVAAVQEVPRGPRRYVRAKRKVETIEQVLAREQAKNPAYVYGENTPVYQLATANEQMDQILYYYRKFSGYQSNIPGLEGKVWRVFDIRNPSELRQMSIAQAQEANLLGINEDRLVKYLRRLREYMSKVFTYSKGPPSPIPEGYYLHCPDQIILSRGDHFYFLPGECQLTNTDEYDLDMVRMLAEAVLLWRPHEPLAEVHQAILNANPFLNPKLKQILIQMVENPSVAILKTFPRYALKLREQRKASPKKRIEKRKN